MSNIIKPFSEYPNTFAAIFKCHAVLTVTHEADDNFRLYERKLYYAINFNDRKRAIEMACGYAFSEDYRLPGFDDEEEVEEGSRYREALACADVCFCAFAKSLRPEEWEVAAAEALESPDEEVPLRGFVAPTVPGFKISATMVISETAAYEILHADEEAEDDE